MKIAKILIFNPFGVGDVLFTTPLIRNLKESLKTVSISYLCNQRTYPLLKNNIFLDQVFVFEKDDWRNLARKSKLEFGKEFLAFFKTIKNNNFDLVFDLSLNSQYGFFFKVAGIKRRIGFNYKKRGMFLTDKIDITPGCIDKHVARYCLDLLKFLDISGRDYPFDLFLANDPAEFKADFFQRNKLDPESVLVAVCPGSGDSWQDTAYFKRWPKENFLQICQKLSKKNKVKVLLLGSRVEAPICRYIEENIADKPLNLCAQTTLDEFSQIISLADLVITNDGGPFHIAQALRKKSFVFYGPVDERVYGPYPDESLSTVFTADLDCRPCYNKFKFTGCEFDKRCLRQISVDRVFPAIEKSLPK